MTIEICKPELEALIRKRLNIGEYKDIEDILIQALKSSSVSEPLHTSRRRILRRFLLESPLVRG